MGKVKDLMIEMEENDDKMRLSKILGISYLDFRELSYEIETDESNEGVIYMYRIEFYDDSPKEILDKIDRLEDGCRVYLHPWELYGGYDYDEQFEAITDNPDYYNKFITEIESIEELISIKLNEEKLKNILNRQIFVSIIGTMETFLSDAFINVIFSKETYFRNFVETHPTFKQRKFELREIFTENQKLKDTAKKVMLDTIYHNLPEVSNMYRDTFKINFPSIREIYSLVLQRHDLVHRNGKTKNGDDVIITETALKELIEKVKVFIKEIQIEIEK